MAGIRGERGFMPAKKNAATGPFTQRGTAGPFMDRDVQSGAMASNRKGPAKRDNGLKKGAGASHHTNAGLKRGTSNR